VGRRILATEKFKSNGDLNRYQAHPAHQEVVEFVKKVRVDRAAVDMRCRNCRMMDWKLRIEKKICQSLPFRRSKTLVKTSINNING